eukprot:scaffold11571_cov57-Phaeocystis_antarctica.AAC.1
MPLAEALKGNTTLTTLQSAAPPSRTHSPVRHGPTACTLAALALFTFLSPCAQPPQQQPWPRGWHGARRGPQGQHDSHVPQVCCPAHRTHPPVRPGPLTCTHHSVHSPPLLLGRVSTPPRRALNATSHSLRVPRT